MKSKNIFLLDVLRALCILWIVVVLHGNDYLPMDYHWVDITIPRAVTNIVLLLFALLSGMLLAKYNFSTKKDVWNFYVKRFSRFYILFFIAVLLFYVCGFYTWKTSLKCLFGISMFIGQAPYTLYYMSMLMVFYLLTPILRYNYKYFPLKYIVPIFVLAGIIMLRVCNVIPDTHAIHHINLIRYFISYELGLLIGQKVTTWLRDHDWNAPASIRFIFENIAYASFCMYLYHRVIFYVVGRILGFADVGNIVFIMPLWCNFLAISLVIVISYAIQLSYDKIFKNIGMKNITLNN